MKMTLSVMKMAPDCPSKDTVVIAEAQCENGVNETQLVLGSDVVDALLVVLDRALNKCEKQAVTVIFDATASPYKEEFYKRLDPRTKLEQQLDDLRRSTSQLREFNGVTIASTNELFVGGATVVKNKSFPGLLKANVSWPKEVPLPFEIVPTKRRTCVALEQMIGMEIKVLDKGFVRVVDYMGDEGSIVQAARVSYGAGTKTPSDDTSLIRYLMRHSHTTPLEMCELKLHVRVPMDCWRQWIRHRTASVNEYSTRYSEAIDDRQQTTEWRLQAKNNKQGSAGLVSEWPEGFEKELPLTHLIARGSLMPAMSEWTPADYLSAREKALHNLSTEMYQERLDFGVAREQARKDLPLSTYTEAYWKIDLHNLLHFLSLRMDKHAQQEIREYANVIGKIVEAWVPNVWQAFNDYNMRRDALLLTKAEKELIKLRMSGVVGEKNIVYAEAFAKLGKTERTEFEAKLEQLGL